LVGFTFPNHPLERAVGRELQVVTSNGDEFGSTCKEVVSERQEGAVPRARERVGLGVDHLDEDVVVDPDGLVLLQALRALQAADCEVDLLGPRLILKLMGMAAYRGFVMRDYFYLPYEGPRIPFITLIQNQI